MSDLTSILAAARAQRDAGAWSAAVRLYNAAAEVDASSFEIKHNLALCHFGLGAHEAALRYSREALSLKPDLWQSRMIQAKVLRADGRIEEAAQALKFVLKHEPVNGHALLALADIEMNEFGDPLAAAGRVAPLRRHPEHSSDAELTLLMSKLYDRDETDEELSEALKAFAARELVLPNFKFERASSGGAPRSSDRPRVGLLSPLFCASPVYYFTIGALRVLCREVDFVVFSRGSRVDWATRGFQTIAREWHQVQHMSAPALANAIKRQDVDVLFDLGGWMDPVGMRALSTRPAKRLYKWVGGQSATTGLSVFDGFISDEEQSPASHQPLYSEPLVNLPGGYVTYEPSTKPDDIASPDPSDARAFPLGVIGNPAKISRAFLRKLEAHIDDSTGRVLFVDRRYRHDTARRRIVDALPARHRQRLHFVAPTDHVEYLAQVRRPGRILDTFPYNGGLTSLEALHLGKTVEFTAGKLFASRHTRSHDRYWRTSKGGVPLRRSHQALASDLLKIIRDPPRPR